MVPQLLGAAVAAASAVCVVFALRREAETGVGSRRVGVEDLQPLMARVAGCIE